MTRHPWTENSTNEATSKREREKGKIDGAYDGGVVVSRYQLCTMSRIMIGSERENDKAGGTAKTSSRLHRVAATAQ